MVDSVLVQYSPGSLGGTSTISHRTEKYMKERNKVKQKPSDQFICIPLPLPISTSGAKFMLPKHLHSQYLQSSYKTIEAEIPKKSLQSSVKTQLFTDSNLARISL